MTNKEFYQAVINLAVSDEMTAKAEHLLELTEKKNEKRAEAQTENYKANMEIFNKIAGLLNVEKTYAISEIRTALAETEFKELSNAKLTAIFKVAAKENCVVITDNYKVGGKGRSVKGYNLA